MGELVINGINVVLTVAGMEFLRLPALWLESARHAPLTRAGLTLPDPDGQVLQALSVGAAVSIVWGYRDQPMDTWNGTVEWMRPGTNDQGGRGRRGSGAGPLPRLASSRRSWTRRPRPSCATA